MAAHCQDCTGCCQVFEVVEINKKFGERCPHIGWTPNGAGCKIYATRPHECQIYVCLWLDSQRQEGKEFAEALRPDVCKVVMGGHSMDPETLFVHPYPGYEGAWRIGAVGDYLKAVLARGAKVIVVEGDKRWALRGDMAIVGTEAEFADMLKDVA